MLHHCVGGVVVTAAQLELLAALDSRSNITIQVVPEAAGAYAGLSGAFAVATRKHVVTVEQGSGLQDRRPVAAGRPQAASSTFGPCPVPNARRNTLCCERAAQARRCLRAVCGTASAERFAPPILKQ